MQQDLRERDGLACLQIFEVSFLILNNKPYFFIFQWSLETLAEISKKNANRRVLFGNGGGGASSSGNNEDVDLSDILQTYMTCRSTRLLLELLNECVGRLLTSSPERCIAGLLETTARFGSFCDWILTFIG